jgi:hypothetical protein
MTVFDEGLVQNNNERLDRYNFGMMRDSKTRPQLHQMVLEDIARVVASSAENRANRIGLIETYRALEERACNLLKAPPLSEDSVMNIFVVAVPGTAPVAELVKVQRLEAALVNLGRAFVEVGRNKADVQGNIIPFQELCNSVIRLYSIFGIETLSNVCRETQEAMILRFLD